MTNSNQTSLKNNWICPCNGCQKSAKQEYERILYIIKTQYYSCPNIEDDICNTWWKHDECEALRSLLYTITGDEKFIEPLTKQRKNWHISFDTIENDPEFKELMERLKKMEDNGI